MSKAKKLALTFLSVLFALTFMLGMVACGGQSAKDAIDAYLLPQDNALVDEDFTLPRKIGIDNGVEVTWKSDNAAITIENGKTADTYNAKVTLQDEVTPVKLTISAGGASKDFTVRVNELSVYTFMNKYTNAAFSKTLSEDFDLDSSFTIQGKTATIVWSVDEKYQTYLEVDPVEPTAGQTQKAIVKPGDDVVKVKITGTFTYGDADPVTQDYELSISPVLDYRQIVNKMYSEANFPIDFAGYVVHVYVAENSEQYGPMATVFAVDEQFGYGYYIWQAALESAEQVSKVKVGAHFTFSGDFTKNYNGLWESNGYEEGTAVFDGKGDKTAEEMEASIRAMDVDIISGVQSAQWQMSRLVSLSGWKVKTAAQVDKNSNVYLTLENGDATVDVYSSIYVATDDDAMTALKAKLNGLEVGAIIDIKGILGYNNSGSTFNTKYFRIQPRSADDITVKTDATEATAYADAAKIKAAQEEVNKVVTANFNSIIMQPKENVEIPTSKEGVTISYRLARSNTAGAATVISGNKITVTPTKAEQNNLIEVTYTIGDAANPTYQAYSLFTIRSWEATDSEVVDEVYNELIAQRISQITSAGDVTLPKAELYGKATVTWTFVIDKDHVEDNWKDWAKISGSKLVIDYLPDEAITLKLNAHIVCGASERNLTFNAKVSAAPTVAFEAITEAKAGTYKFAMYSGNKKATYYATGAMDGYYFATTTDNTKAADFVIKQIGTANQYTIQVNGKYLEFAARSDGSKGVDIKMNDTQTTGKYWQWVEAIQNFVFESTYNESGAPDATDLYYFGNYSTNTSMSGNYIGRITTKSGDVYTANGKEGVDQWVAHFGKIIELTDELRADEILARCEPSQTTFVDGGNYELFTTKQYNAQITYSLANTAPDNITLDGTTLRIILPATGKVQAELTVTVKVGNVTKTERYTIIAKMYDGAGTSENPFTVEDAIVIGKKLQAQGGTAYYKAAGESDPTRVYITGYVTDVGKPNLYNDVYQGVQDVLIASTAGGTATLKLSFVYYDKEVMVKQGDGSVNPLHVGDQVVVWGWLESFNGGVATVYSYSGTYPVFTSWKKVTLTDDIKAQDVANGITFNKTDIYAGQEDIDLTTTTDLATQYNASIAWTVSTNDYLEVVGNNKLHLKSTPTGQDAVDVTLTLTVKVGTDGTATRTFTIHVHPATAEPEKGTADNPYTPAEAKNAAKNLEGHGSSATVYSSGIVWVRGIICNISYAKDGSWSFYIADAATTDKNDAKAFQVYGLYLENTNGLVTLKDDVAVGATVLVSGCLQNYHDSGLEITSNGDKKLTLLEYTDPRSAADKANAAIQAAKDVLDKLTLTENVKDYALPASILTGVTLVYSGTGVTDNKLTVNQTDTEQKITITISATNGTPQTATVTVAAKSAEDAGPQVLQPVDAAPESGDYYLGMKVGYEWYYITGSESSNYLATTTNVANAAIVKITKNGEDYTLQVKSNSKYIEVIKSTSGNKTYYNAKLPTAQTAGQVWKWNATHKLFTMSVEGTDYFLGTYTNNGSTRTTMGASAISYAENDTNILAKVGTIVNSTDDEDKAYDLLKSITIKDIYSAENATGEALPAPDKYNAEVVWSVMSASEDGVVSVENNTLKILKLATGTDAKITLKVIVQVGEKTLEKEFIIFVETPVPSAPNDPTSVEVTLSEYGSAHGWNDSTTNKTLEVDNNIEVTVTASDSNSGKLYGDGWRIYQSGSPQITFNTKNSASIFSIKITYTTSSNGILTSEAGKVIASDKIVYVQGTSFTFIVGNSVVGGTSGQVRISKIVVTYTGGATLTDEDIAQGAIDLIDVTVKELTENYKLPESSVDGVTLNWSIEGDVGESGNEAAKIENAQGGGQQITVNRKATDVTFTLKVTATYNGKTTQPKSFTGITVKRALKEGENVLGFVNFNGFDWTNSYTSHTVDFSAVGGTVSGTVEFDNANKQTNTMKDRPCIGAKNAGATGHVTVKLTEASKEFSEIKFNMYGYNTITFENIWIEYSVNGTDDWTILGSKSGEVKTVADGTYTYTATSIPAGVKYVRLVVEKSGGSAKQIGLTSIEFTVKDSAPAAASVNTFSAPVADLPHKD